VKLCKVADIRQSTDYGCGAACIDTVCDYWSQPRPRRSMANHVQGMAPEMIEGVLRERGFQVMRGELYTTLLQALTRDGVPVICAISEEDAGHWVVAIGVGRGKVFFHDPEEGQRSMPVGEWEAMWCGHSEAGVSFNRWGIAPHLT
jgi:predicted double-glycine peptidase